MSPTAHILSLVKIIQELNHSNWRSLESILRPKSKVKSHLGQSLEAQILRQRLHLLDSLLNHLQGKLLDQSAALDHKSPRIKATTEHSSFSQQWDQTWLELTQSQTLASNRDGVNAEQRELEQELQQLILLCLRLFKKLGLDPAQVLNNLSLKLAQNTHSLVDTETSLRSTTEQHQNPTKQASSSE